MNEIQLTYEFAEDNITLHQFVYMDTVVPITKIQAPPTTWLMNLIDLPQAEFWLN